MRRGGERGLREAIGGIALALLVCFLALSGFDFYISPTPVAMVPKPDARVGPLDKIKVTFNRPMATSRAKVEIHGDPIEGGKFTVDGSWEYIQSGHGIVFTSSTILQRGTYNVIVSAQGNELANWSFSVADPQPIPPNETPSILVIKGETRDFSAYYAEILRAEGFMGFKTTTLADFPKLELTSFGSIIVSGAVDDASAMRLRVWVEDGGNLIAILPSGAVAALAGVTPQAMARGAGYLKFDTSRQPGQGLIKEEIQFHGDAVRFAIQPETRILASLRFEGSSETHPAATLRSVGSKGGEVGAFAFNLAQSVVYTRQGNPEWAKQDRDGLAPKRPNDLFFGNAKHDPQPDFLDLAKAHIPQADEQMRFLTNLLMHQRRDATPLVRFWYFPKLYKAAIVMSADDHGTKNGTKRFFQLLDGVSPEGCDAAKWECARATSWIFASSGLKDRDAKRYAAIGFDLGSHISTDCQDWTSAILDGAIARDLAAFQERFPSLDTQASSRLHCIAWSEYTTQAEVERSWGIRFDMNYYYWPANWLKGSGGFMTGSGLPMRFSKSNGEIIDVYQQETHLVDEVFFSHPKAIEGLIERATGPEEFYGAFGTHFDFNNGFAPMVVEIARKWQVPMVSAKQMLEWQDSRSHSNVEAVQWNGEGLQFSISANERAEGLLTAMIPMEAKGHRLTALKRGNTHVAFGITTIKGIEYALFPGSAGSYQAAYSNEPARK